ncbi:MAG: sel1 repeat family protein [Planctomycetes bacterium]|nr:sel1 repeat family protein [Planctomycetota bacterium]
MRRLLIALPLLLAACAGTSQPQDTPQPTAAEATADKLSPRQAYEEAIRLRDSNQLAEAEAHLYSSARRGYSDAQYELAIWLFTARNGREDQAEGAQWMEKAAGAGHVDARRLVWQLYLFGQGVEQSNERAFDWLKIAAEHGDAEVIYHLGLAYFDGIGTERDPVKAAEQFLLAADKGHGGACYYLGVMHLEGEGVQKNDQDAFAWFSTGAGFKHPACYLGMGDCYRDGRGVEKSIKKARDWYTLVLLATEDGDLLDAATNRLADLGP